MKLARLIDESPSVGIVLMVLAVFFTVCVGHVNSASEPGTVTIVLAVEPRSLDPGNTADDHIGRVLLGNILETLTEMNYADSSMMPGLAHSWKQIDANTWHFFLRKGIKFHDGTDFNAEAVVFNIKRIYDKKVVSHTGGKYFSDFNLEGKALDSHTLELKTDRFKPLLPVLMGFMAICSPNTPLDKPTRQPIGTGPYKFGRWDAGMQITFERFDGYWGKQPQVKKAVYVWRNESSVRAAMVSIGEADLVPDIAKQDATRSDMDYSYINADTTQLRIGGAWEPPFNDRRFRMALNYAVDRNAIRGSILSSDVIPATQLVIPSIFGYNHNLKLWPYDTQKAKQLLDEARRDGVPVDKEILLVARIGYFPGSAELIEAVHTMWKAIGLNVKLKMVDVSVHGTYNKRPNPPGLYILLKSHTNNSGDAGFTAFYNYHCKGGSGSMCDKITDDLIEKAEAATGEARRNLWQTTFKRIYEDVIPDVPLFHLVAYTRVGKRINFKPSVADTTRIELARITFK